MVSGVTSCRVEICSMSGGDVAMFHLCNEIPRHPNASLFVAYDGYQFRGYSSVLFVI
jgi:hypothetical protein